MYLQSLLFKEALNMANSLIDFLLMAKAKGFPFLRLGASFNPLSTCKITGLLSFCNSISFQGYGFLRNPFCMPYSNFEKHREFNIRYIKTKEKMAPYIPTTKAGGFYTVSDKKSLRSTSA